MLFMALECPVRAITWLSPYFKEVANALQARNQQILLAAEQTALLNRMAGNLNQILPGLIPMTAGAFLLAFHHPAKADTKGIGRYGSGEWATRRTASGRRDEQRVSEGAKGAVCELPEQMVVKRSSCSGTQTIARIVETLLRETSDAKGTERLANSKR
jgi:hypothetical protein